MDPARAEEIKRTVPEHTAYWHKLNLDGYKGGPFSDLSGGLILFKAENEEKAEEIVHEDPFVDHFILTKKWVKEWAPVTV